MRLEFLEEKEVLFETVEARDPPSTCELLNFEEHLWNSSSLKLPEIPRDLTWHYLTFNKSESYARDDGNVVGWRSLAHLGQRIDSMSLLVVRKDFEDGVLPR